MQKQLTDMKNIKVAIKKLKRFRINKQMGQLVREAKILKTNYLQSKP